MTIKGESRFVTPACPGVPEQGITPSDPLILISPASQETPPSIQDLSCLLSRQNTELPEVPAVEENRMLPPEAGIIEVSMYNPLFIPV